jgi:hypothetical protein
MHSASTLLLFPADNQEQYSFVIPVLKALLEKLTVTLALANHLPGLPQTQAGPAFFDDFQSYCQAAEWKLFLDRKVGQLEVLLLEVMCHLVCHLACCLMSSRCSRVTVLCCAITAPLSLLMIV